jgi:hypothetical protein
MPGSLSSTRPPVYNPDNCSCVEASIHSRDAGNQYAQTEQNIYHYDNTTALFEKRPVTYASSSLSANFQGPEGPERELPDMQLDKFLAVAPEPGLGEARHRRTSFRSEMSFQMHRYMEERHDLQAAFEQEQQKSYHNTFYLPNHEQKEPSNRYLNQDVYIRPPTGRGSGKTKSWESEDSGGSGESSLEAWETAPVDPIRGIGAWASYGTGEESIIAAGYGCGYPMSMSGMTEALYEIERR